MSYESAVVEALGRTAPAGDPPAAFPNALAGSGTRGSCPNPPSDSAEEPISHKDHILARHIWRNSARCSVNIPSPSPLHPVLTPFLLSRQCWYCASRASGMKRILSSGQLVSAAMANTCEAR